MPKYKCHPSTESINGESSWTTTFFINEKIDTGILYYNRKLRLRNWHVNDLHDLNVSKWTQIQFKFSNDYLLKQTKTAEPKHQYARKILKHDYQLDQNFGNKVFKNIFNFIRGMSPQCKTNIQIHKDDQIFIKKIIITRVKNFKKNFT